MDGCGSNLAAHLDAAAEMKRSTTRCLYIACRVLVPHLDTNHISNTTRNAHQRIVSVKGVLSHAYECAFVIFFPANERPGKPKIDQLMFARPKFWESSASCTTSILPGVLVRYALCVPVMLTVVNF